MDKKQFMAYQMASQAVQSVMYKDAANEHDINNELEEIAIELERKSKQKIGDLCLNGKDRKIEKQAIEYLNNNEKINAIRLIKAYYKLDLKTAIKYAGDLI